MRNVAVAAMTKNLADELGPLGINVTVVHPGLTWTERIPGMVADQADAQGLSTHEVEQRMAEGNSVRRMIERPGNCLSGGLSSIAQIRRDQR